MNRSFGFSLVSIVLAVGCSTSSDHHGANASTAFDQQFIDMMTPHHEGAVEMAKIAQTRAAHAEIKTMASAIITAQQKEIGDMKGWRKRWYGSDQTPTIGEMPMLEGMDHSSHVDM